MAFLAGDLESADRALDKLIDGREEKQEILAKLGLWEDWKAVDQRLQGMN